MRLTLTACLVAPLALFMFLTPGASAAKVKVIWWDPFVGPPYEEVLQNIVDGFNKSQRNIQVVRQTGGGADIQKLAVAMTVGNGPDCANIWGSSNASQLWAMGLTRPMDDLMVADKKMWDQVYPAFMNSLKFRGKQLGFPDAAQTHLLYWNKDLFSRAGLDPMRAPLFEELDVYAAKLTKKNSDGKLVTVGMNPVFPWGGFEAWVSLFGGQLYDPLQEKVTANAEANLKAMHWLDDFVKTRGGYAALSPGGSIEGGKVAMQLDPHYIMKAISTAKNKINFMIGLPPAPGGLGAGRGPMVAINCNIILRGAKHPREAYEFLKYYVASGGPRERDTPAAALLKSLNDKFPQPEMVPDGLWKSVALKVLELARPALSMPGAERYLAELSAGVYSVALGKKSPEQALQAAQVVGDRYFRETLKRARWGK